MRNPENPNHFFLARSLAPALVTQDDIVEHDLECNPVGNETRPLYLERFIHGSVYETRPDVIAVVHAHAEAILPYAITTGTPLRPVIHSGSFIGAHVPVWDIADRFGDTNLLVTNMDQGRDLAATLAGNNVALMRGHGFVAAARSLIEVVRMSVYLPRNARALTTAQCSWVGRSHRYPLVRLRSATRLPTALIRQRRHVRGSTGSTDAAVNTWWPSQTLCRRSSEADPRWWTGSTAAKACAVVTSARRS